MKTNLAILNHVSAGFTAVLVGYTSSIVIILQAATAAGASQSQTESWLLTLGVTMGLTSIGYSWFYRTPILTAWSTPGAALLVTFANQYQLPSLVGAFMVTGVFIFLTGFISPLTRALERIPAPLATAMLAAILMPFCIGAFEAVTTTPVIFVVMFAAYLFSKHLMPRFTMLLLLLIGLLGALLSGDAQLQGGGLSIARPEWVNPYFDMAAILNVSIPLYIVTMLSQNLPGVAMLRAHNYEVPIRPILMGTGSVNIVSAPFGGFSINLAAITAAICLSDTADPDEHSRYRASMWAGVFYLLAGTLASTVVLIFLALPTDIAHMLAGFALLGTLMMCLQNAFKDDGLREPALLTFLVTLSGVSIFGIGAALCGLMIGGVSILMSRLTRSV